MLTVQIVTRVTLAPEVTVALCACIEQHSRVHEGEFIGSESFSQVITAALTFGPSIVILRTGLSLPEYLFHRIGSAVGY